MKFIFKLPCAEEFLSVSHHNSGKNWVEFSSYTGDKKLEIKSHSIEYCNEEDLEKFLKKSIKFPAFSNSETFPNHDNYLKEVNKAIEDYLTYELFLSLYLNAEGDYAQRMQKAEIEHQKSMGEALYNVKLPSFLRMKKYAEELPQSLEIFNLPSNADRIQRSDQSYINRQQPITRYW